MKIEYVVLQGNSLDEIIAEVERFLAEGWELQGGISVAPFPDEVDGKFITCLVFHQALVREIKKGKPKGGVGF